MKFTKLSKAFNQLVKKKKKGKKIKPKKVNSLLKLLDDKKLRYEKKLKLKLDINKQKSFETKLKVVNAQIKKTKLLL